MISRIDFHARYMFLGGISSESDLPSNRSSDAIPADGDCQLNLVRLPCGIPDGDALLALLERRLNRTKRQESMHLPNHLLTNKKAVALSPFCLFQQLPKLSSVRESDKTSH